MDRVVRLIYSYSTEDLAATLRSLGLEAGDTLIVHSGFRRFSGFRGTADDVIRTLLSVIGPEGNLAMVSMPYRGSSEAWVERGEVFDVASTPSAMGLISELFRRREDVVRSLCPLHPVIAKGPKTAWLTADHEKLPHTCGKGTPFHRMLGLAAKALFFDAPFRSLTFMHYVEDLYADALPVPLYADEFATVRARTRRGEVIELRQAVFSKPARERRDFEAVERELIANHLLEQRRLGNSTLLSIRVRDVLECVGRMMDDGRSFYAQ